MGASGFHPIPVTPLEQQPNMLQMLAGVQQVKNQQQQGVALGQENQQRQMSIQDQQAMTAAMHEWDGKDLNGLTPLMVKHGASANAVIGLKGKILEQQEKYSTIAKNDADTGQKNLESMKMKNDAIVGGINSLKDIPDEQLAQAIPGVIQSLTQQGALSPQESQQAGQLVQSGDPAAIRKQLSIFSKLHSTASQQMDQAAKDAQAFKDKQQGNEAQVKTALDQIKLNLSKNSKPGDFDAQIDQIYPPNSQAGGQNRMTKAVVNSSLQRGDFDGARKFIDQAFQNVQDVNKDIAVATNPQIQKGKEDVAAAEGRAKANIEAQTARGSNAALATVPPHLIGPATTAATKAGEDYAAAQAVTQRMNATMDAARKGNVVSYQIIPEEGTLQITTSQGVRRINKTEIEQYAGGGSLWQRLEGHLGKQLSGKSIPDSVLNDMAEIQKIQADGSQAKYENSLKTINQNYGSQFQPVKMETVNSGAAQHTPGAKVSLPEGSTGKGSDGKPYIVKGGVWVAQ